MTLIWNWQTVLGSAWSVRLGTFSALLGGFQQAAGFIPAGFLGLSPEVWTAVGAVFGALSILCAALVVPARLIDQKLGVVTSG
jgi:hypothetical protein